MRDHIIEFQKLFSSEKSFLREWQNSVENDFLSKFLFAEEYIEKNSK